MSANKPLDEHLQLIPNLCRVQAIFVLILFSELLVLILVLFSSPKESIAWDTFGTGSFYVQWVVLLIALTLCRLRPWLAKMRVFLAYASAYAVILLIHFGVALLSQAFLSSNLQQPWEWHWIVKTQLITAIVGLLILHYFYVQYRVRQQEQAELRLKVDALQSRIQPHFLFNSMNSIASLVDIDPQRAEHAIVDLSELFRASLKESGTLVPLERELRLCQGYLRIEKLRLSHRLKVSWVLKVPADHYLMPLLTLQPLLENAIIHGIQKRREGGEIRIRTFSVAGELFIDVRNPLPDQVQEEVHADKGNHMALQNIRDRLETLFPGRGKISGQIVGDYYISTLRLPLTPVDPAGTPQNQAKQKP